MGNTRQAVNRWLSEVSIRTGYGDRATKEAPGTLHLRPTWASIGTTATAFLLAALVVLLK